MIFQQPSYQLTCTRLNDRPGCGWSGKFYFDRPLPGVCPRCNPDGTKGDRRLRTENLTITRSHPAPIGGDSA